MVFLPLEIALSVLEKSGHFLARVLTGETKVDIERVNFLKAATEPVVEIVTFASAGLPHPIAGIAVILVGVTLLFLSLTFLGRLLKRLMVGHSRRILTSVVGRGPLASIGPGALFTMIVQSSSTSTSLIVLLAETGVFTLRQVYSFTLGANIGTCVTALMAATTVGGAKAFFALQIALIHLLY